MRNPIIASVFCALLCSGCASSKSNTEPGIQSVEKSFLVSDFYWRPGDQTNFTDDQMGDLFARSTQIDPIYDGERSELQCSRLILALSAAGDKHFSELLSQQPRKTIKATLRHMDTIWTDKKLHYPLTEALIDEKFRRAYKEAEKANPDLTIYYSQPGH